MRKPRVSKLQQESEFQAVVWLISPDTGKLTPMLINKRMPSLSTWITPEVAKVTIG